MGTNGAVRSGWSFSLFLWPSGFHILWSWNFLLFCEDGSAGLSLSLWSVRTVGLSMSAFQDSNAWGSIAQLWSDQRHWGWQEQSPCDLHLLPGQEFFSCMAGAPGADAPWSRLWKEVSSERPQEPFGSRSLLTEESIWSWEVRTLCELGQPHLLWASALRAGSATQEAFGNVTPLMPLIPDSNSVTATRDQPCQRGQERNMSLFHSPFIRIFAKEASCLKTYSFKPQWFAWWSIIITSVALVFKKLKRS